MKTYLLTWNPKYYDASREEQYVAKRGSCSIYWSTNCMKIQKNDKILLMRQGTEPRGIVAIGQALPNNYLHEDGRWYVPVRFSWFKCNEPLLSLKDLNVLFPDQHWSPRGSGILVKPPIDLEVVDMISKIILEKEYAH